MNSLSEQLQLSPYQAYAYAYPHKTAYRDLPTPVDLHKQWSGEDRAALFAYVHIPFCTYRCGFCNLFALGRPQDDLVASYVRQLIRQIRVVREVLGEHRFVRFALGGGTPSYLQPAQLASVLEAVTREFTIDLQTIPAGIEVSPETATPDRLQLCRDAGIDRVSMGVQSFIDTELQALVRPTPRQEILAAIDAIRRLGFPTLNLDLIYGIRGQSLDSLRHSVRAALSFQPEEMYLYPLYVRPRTGLGRIESRECRNDNDTRMQMYYAARELLLEAGYTQVSMRMFRSPSAPDVAAPAYCCQNDGMVGIGCGARSYTQSLHYSDRYGVARSSVSEILRGYVSAPENSFAQAGYGFVLDEREQRRRYVIQSLLVRPGLDESAYVARFGTPALDDLPQLYELIDTGLAQRHDGLVALSDAGMARADTIGPWLYSEQVTAGMNSYAVA